MSGHNKWSKIKHKKGAEDARKSRIFSKISRLLTSESKRVGGNLTSPSLITVIDLAKRENMPKDTIDRAIKKGTDNDTAALETIVYEAYAPGGAALLIEVLTDNRNRAAAEVRHLLSKNGIELAAPGSASWAFERQNLTFKATTKIPISDEDAQKTADIIDALEELEDVQSVYTNAEGFDETT